jgi:hypothetical protein
VLSSVVYGAVAALRRRSAAARYGLLVLIAMACAVATCLADVTIGDLLRRLVDPAAPTRHAPLLFRIVSNTLTYYWMFALVGALYMMLQANRAVAERERQLADARTAAAEAEAAASAARLAVLRYQLNPHFLFNTLNAVSSAVITRRNDEAESMLEKLAEFLRVTLAADPEGLIPLEDELATIQA